MTTLPPRFARSSPMTTMFSPSEVLEVKAISLTVALINWPKRRLRSCCFSAPKSTAAGAGAAHPVDERLFDRVGRKRAEGMNRRRVHVGFERRGREVGPDRRRQHAARTRRL